ncbi:hypothetical protein D1007_20792 [Hordeum vulgare]|nr:hypothetical protein D1007_20792 [Hordeum vulgare]
MALAKLHGLKDEIKRARQEAEEQKAMDAEAQKARAAEQVAWWKDQAWVLEVEENPIYVFEAHDRLQAEVKQAKEEPKNLQLTHSKLQVVAWFDRQVL